MPSWWSVRYPPIRYFHFEGTPKILRLVSNLLIFYPLWRWDSPIWRAHSSTIRNVTFSIVRWSSFPSSVTRTSSQRSTGAKWDENGPDVVCWQMATSSRFLLQDRRFCWLPNVCSTSQESALQTFALRDLRIGRCGEESDGLSFWVERHCTCGVEVPWESKLLLKLHPGL